MVGWVLSVRSDMVKMVCFSMGNERPSIAWILDLFLSCALLLS